MMKRIILHGHLKKLYDKPIEVEASTVAEAVRALQFIPELQPKDGNPWPVTIQGINSDIALYSVTNMEEIHVYPRTGGAGGRNGLLQILIGVALIALAVMNPALLFAEAGGLLSGVGISAGMIGLSGAMMVLGGIMQMLMPVPENNNVESSIYLGASQNTVRIGTPIPMLYGTRKIGGQYLSFDVDAKDIALSGDPNEASEGKPNYYKYDATSGISIPPFRPVYTSQTPSSSNIPVAA